MVGKAESSFGTSPAGVEYVRAVSLCSPLFFSFFYITSRLASRPASRFACRSCVSPCVPLGVSFCVFCLSYRPCVSSFRFAFHACPWAIAFDMGTVLPCSPLTLPCRLSRFVFLYSVPRLALRAGMRLVLRPVFIACRVMRPDFRMGRRFVLLAACRLALRLVLGVCVSALYAALASRFSSRHAVSCSMPFLVSVLRFRSASCHCVPLFCLPVGCDFHEAPFRLARRSSYAMSNDPDETRREVETMRWNETREARRRARRGTESEGEEEREFLLLVAFNYIGAVSSCSSLIPFSVSSFPVPPCVSVSRIALRSIRSVLSCVPPRFRLVPCLVPHPRPFSSHRAFRTRGNREGSSREG